MNNNCTVWIPQEPMRREGGAWISKGFNLAATAEYGSMRIVWGPDTSILDRDALEDTARRAASDYDPEADYVVALGSPTLIAMLSWAIGEAGKPIYMLEWDKPGRRYYPTLVTQKG